MSDHTEISPSGLSRLFTGHQIAPGRWEMEPRCPGSVRLCRPLPESPQNKYAAEGSVAHYLAERCLNEGRQAVDYLGKVGWYNNERVGIGSSDLAPREQKGDHFCFDIKYDMTDAVQVYLDSIRETRNQLIGAKFLVEEKLNLDWLIPGLSGTGDHICIEPMDRLVIDDYKHGVVAVDVVNNSQVMAYGLMAVGEKNVYSVEEVELRITQPRAPKLGGAVGSTTMDTGNLLAWGQQVLVPGVKLALTDKAPLKMGDWCGWCEAKKPVGDWPGCPMIRQSLLDKVDGIIDIDMPVEAQQADMPEVTGMPGNEISNWLKFAETFESFVKGIREEAHSRLSQGRTDAPDDWKLIKGKQSNRKYVKGIDVYDHVKTHISRDEAHEPEKARSPAQLEKALSRAGYTHEQRTTIMEPLLAARTRGKPMMVKSTDERKAMTDLIDDFMNN